MREWVRLALEIRKNGSKMMRARLLMERERRRYERLRARQDELAGQWKRLLGREGAGQVR